ncbi:MAG: hypothetical protein H0U95_11675 [Bacteroidetes bacterium]|nr:hypothetical protein [Bacteroidota bacterium]
MKTIVLLLIVPFLGLTQINKLDEKNGFKNFLFGTSPAEYKNLILEIDDGNTKLYSLDQSPIRLDDIDFEYLRLTFYKNKLSSISLQTKNANGTKFFQNLKENYGEPVKINKLKENYEWKSTKYQVLYENNEISGDATTSFYTKTGPKK